MSTPTLERTTGCVPVPADLDTLYHARMVECGRVTYLFIYQSLWMDKIESPEARWLEEFVRDTGAVLIDEVIMHDWQMMHRRARLMAYRVMNNA